MRLPRTDEEDSEMRPISDTPADRGESAPPTTAIFDGPESEDEDTIANEHKACFSDTLTGGAVVARVSVN